MSAPSQNPVRSPSLAVIASWAVFVLGVLYAVITAIGLLRLPDPDSPIAAPYFQLMELLILLMAPLMVISFAGLKVHCGSDHAVGCTAALGFMIAMASLTSAVHGAILFLGPDAAQSMPLLFSFRWPSLVYVLDILAWDWFYALAMLLAATVFRRRWPALHRLMLASSVLSLAGLAGVVEGNMMIRNIGIIGYGVLGPVVFLLLGVWFRRRERN